MFRLLAQEIPAARLHEVRRFDAQWEREASIRLRDGNLAAVAAYNRHGRIRGADEAAACDRAASMWLADHLRGKEIYPAHRDRGRTTAGASEFTMKLEPKNLGVMLRRKLDYAFPNQRAELFVADASRGQEETGLEWQPAGVWYLAGSNTCVYSNPKDELGATQHVVQTSNRRFRDDEFLVPRALTQGRSAIASVWY